MGSLMANKQKTVGSSIEEAESGEGHRGNEMNGWMESINEHHSLIALK